MPLDLHALEAQGVPSEVLNELAILEDRALRAEDRADRAELLLEDRSQELTRQRDIVDGLNSRLRHVRTWLQALERAAGTEVEGCEQALQHMVVIAAR